MQKHVLFFLLLVSLSCATGTTKAPNSPQEESQGALEEPRVPVAEEGEEGNGAILAPTYEPVVCLDDEGWPIECPAK